MTDVPEHIAHDLAVALHRCAAFLPLFIEDSWKLKRAEAAYDQYRAAINAYCEFAGIRPADLCEAARVLSTSRTVSAPTDAIS